MKYSSPSCHSSRSFAPYIIQEGEGGCIEGKREQTGARGEGRRRTGRGRGGFHRGNCADGIDERGGVGRWVTAGRQCRSSARVENGRVKGVWLVTYILRYI